MARNYKKPKLHTTIPIGIITVSVMLLCYSMDTMAKNVDFSPFLEYRSGADWHYLKFLGPVLEISGKDGSSELALRPLMYLRKDSKEVDADFLFPLGKIRKKPSILQIRVTPIFDYVRKNTKRGQEKRFELLTLYWARNTAGQHYAGLFPLIGSLKNRFNHKEVTFILWPLYYRTTDEDAVRHHLLWFIAKYAHGEEVREYRLFPFLSYEKGAENSKRISILWPFYSYESEEAAEKLILFPIYARERRDDTRTTWILWPFFSRTYDAENEQWNLPWPFVNIARGEDVNRVKLFPLFKLEATQSGRSGYLLWPLYQHSMERSTGSAEEECRFLLLLSYKKEKKKNGSVVCVNFWPLFRYSYNTSRDHKFTAPVVLPIESEGAEKNLQPLATLFKSRKSRNHGVRWELLWGLAKGWKTKNEKGLGIPLLYIYSKKGGIACHSFLGGLIEIKGVK